MQVYYITNIPTDAGCHDPVQKKAISGRRRSASLQNRVVMTAWLGLPNRSRAWCRSSRDVGSCVSANRQRLSLFLGTVGSESSRRDAGETGIRCESAHSLEGTTLQRCHPPARFSCVATGRRMSIARFHVHAQPWWIY